MSGREQTVHPVILINRNEPLGWELNIANARMLGLLMGEERAELAIKTIQMLGWYLSRLDGGRGESFKKNYLSCLDGR